MGCGGVSKIFLFFFCLLSSFPGLLLFAFFPACASAVGGAGASLVFLFLFPWVTEDADAAISHGHPLSILFSPFFLITRLSFAMIHPFFLPSHSPLLASSFSILIYLFFS